MHDPPRQLDLFADGRHVMLRNDVVHALAQRDATGAAAAWATFAGAYPQDPALPMLQRLMQTLARRDGDPVTDHDALARERVELERDLAPAARQAFGDAAGEAWLRPLWRSLAARSAGLPFRPARAGDHAAASWLRGEDWAAAVRAVERIESWYRIPAALAWAIEARCRLGALDECWAMLAELAWLSPDRFDDLLRRLQEPLLTRLHRQFGTDFDGGSEIADLAWFPAWLLTETPALAPHLALARPSQGAAPERGMRLMLDLLSLERQGRHQELVQRRRVLRDLHEPLYEAYMATR